MSKKFISMLVMICMLTAMIISLPMVTYAAGTVYYVDAANGNDNNSGTSQSSAWATLEKVNGITFQPGDQILFKAGGVWNGQLHPKGSGSSGSPIIIDMYGSGNKPIIDGGGIAGAAVYLYNQEYWEINNLEVTNDAATGSLQRAGILIESRDSGTKNHIYIKNCYVHNCKGMIDTQNPSGNKDNGGIIFRISGSTTPTNWNDILVEGNTVEHCDRSGIYFHSGWCNRYDVDGGAGPIYFSHNIIARNNTINDIGGDGFVLTCTDSGTVEYNTVSETNCRNLDLTYNAALWMWNCENTVWQYNESYNTRTDRDGMSFDFDNLTRNNIYQYNYSHDNEGGLLLFAAGGLNENNIFRYNISENDGCYQGGGVTTKVIYAYSAAVDNNYVYNNTVYFGPGNPKGIWTQGISKIYFFNNIFWNNGSGTYDTNGCIFDANIYHGNNPIHAYLDPHFSTANPKLVNPGSGGTGMNTVDGYKLQSDSPCINAGRAISNNGGKDYWGNSIVGAADIGANEYTSGSGGSTPTPPPTGTVWVDDRDASVSYGGSWVDLSDSNAYNGTRKDCDATNNYTQFTFNGTSVKWIGMKQGNCGYADIYIDGTLDQTVDCYAANGQAQVELYSKSGLTSGQHTIKVVVKGQRNASSLANYLITDAFVYENGTGGSTPTPPPSGTVKVDDRDAAISYGSGWNDISDPNCYNSTRKDSNTTNSYTQLTFTGTSVKWLGMKQGNCGYADIYIDGVLDQTVDCYAANGQAQVVLYNKTGLTDGQHTIKVVVNGQKNASSVSNYLITDAFEYTSGSGGSTPTPTPSGTVKVDDRDATVSYGSGWNDISDGNSYNSTRKDCNTTGSHTQFTFNGTSIKWIGMKQGNCGYADIYIDGVLDQTVDCYASGTIAQVVLYNKTGLSSGQHTIKVVVNGQKNASAVSNYLITDAFEYGN